MRKLEPLFAHLEETIRRRGGPGEGGIESQPRDEAAERKKHLSRTVLRSTALLALALSAPSAAG